MIQHVKWLGIFFGDLFRLAQYGDRARHSRRFNDQKQELLEKPTPLAFFTLKRRERRAPIALNSCHPVLRVSIGGV
jgi:hypothetical protein